MFDLFEANFMFGNTDYGEEEGPKRSGRMSDFNPDIVKAIKEMFSSGSIQSLTDIKKLERFSKVDGFLELLFNLSIEYKLKPDQDLYRIISNRQFGGTGRGNVIVAGRKSMRKYSDAEESEDDEITDESD